MRRDVKIKTAMYAGSFDPFTNGHLSIVKTASELFDLVFVCIASNADKNRHTDVLAMKKAIEKTLQNEGLNNCKVVICDTLIAKYCKKYDIGYLIRGLRNTSDYLYEENIAKINQEINPDLKTIYLRGDNDVISSSMIRELLKYGESINKYVPNEIANLLTTNEAPKKYFHQGGNLNGKT